MGATKKTIVEDELEVETKKKKVKTSKVKTGVARSKYRDNQPGLKRNFRNFCRNGGLRASNGLEAAKKLADSQKYQVVRPAALRIIEEERIRLEDRVQRKLDRLNDPKFLQRRRNSRMNNLRNRISVFMAEMHARDNIAKQINDFLAKDISVDFLNEQLAACRDPNDIRADISRLNERLTRLVNAK